MDHGAILFSSLTYVKETRRQDRWIYLFIYLLINTVTLCIIPLFFGYLYRIMEAKPGVPAVSSIKDLFIKGWKMNIAGLIYALPVLITTAVFYFLIAGFIPVPSNSLGLTWPRGCCSTDGAVCSLPSSVSPSFHLSSSPSSQPQVSSE